MDLQKRYKYNKESLEASSGDSKTLYKKLNRLLGNASNDLPSDGDPAQLAEDFKNLFSEKVNKIREDIETEAEILVETIDRLMIIHLNKMMRIHLNKKMQN